MTDFSETLDLRGDYPCPLCRRGRLNELTLMDALGCQNCGHLFEANLAKQSVRAIDRSPPLTWRWTGRGWRAAHRDDVAVGWTTWVAAGAFAILPTAIVATATYIFPPLPGTPMSALPAVWTGLTFVCHAACVVWLVLEYYQFPILSYLGWRR